MPNTIREIKHQLREQSRQVRKALGEDFQRQASAAICHHIESWPLFKGCETILIYMPMRGEVDLRPLLERHPHKRWLLPRILSEGRMVFHPYDPEHLIRHSFGMLEPDPILPIVPLDQIQLALVPGLAFDRRGWRLGYGGGFFDRFLAGINNGISLGVTYHALLLDHLPHNENDIPMQYIVTEEGVSDTSHYGGSLISVG
ncbi:MAG: 5-formyltetrahydrofolate cyclo-ligase [Anaerolineales bacterium]|nr:5-formyltetrahydrofolate cyclo-ligase [Anaerolineales bacterium]